MRHLSRHQTSFWLLVGGVLLLALPLQGTPPARWLLTRVRRSFGDMQLLA